MKKVVLAATGIGIAATLAYAVVGDTVKTQSVIEKTKVASELANRYAMERGENPASLAALKNYYGVNTDFSNYRGAPMSLSVLSNNTIQIDTRLQSSQTAQKQKEYFLNSPMEMWTQRIDNGTLKILYPYSLMALANVKVNALSKGFDAYVGMQPLGTAKNLWLSSAYFGSGNYYELMYKDGGQWKLVEYNQYAYFDPVTGSFLDNRPIRLIKSYWAKTTVGVANDVTPIQCQNGATYNPVKKRCEAYTSSACPSGYVYIPSMDKCRRTVRIQKEKIVKKNKSVYYTRDWSATKRKTFMFGYLKPSIRSYNGIKYDYKPYIHKYVGKSYTSPSSSCYSYCKPGGWSRILVFRKERVSFYYPGIGMPKYYCSVTCPAPYPSSALISVYHKATVSANCNDGWGTCCEYGGQNCSNYCPSGYKLNKSNKCEKDVYNDVCPKGYARDYSLFKNDGGYWHYTGSKWNAKNACKKVVKVTNPASLACPAVEKYYNSWQYLYGSLIKGKPSGNRDLDGYTCEYRLYADRCPIGYKERFSNNRYAIWNYNHTIAGNTYVYCYKPNTKITTTVTYVCPSGTTDMGSYCRKYEYVNPSCSGKRMPVAPYYATPYYGHNGVCYSDAGLYCKTHGVSWDGRYTCFDNRYHCVGSSGYYNYNYGGRTYLVSGRYRLDLNAGHCVRGQFYCNAGYHLYGLKEHPVIVNPTILYNGVNDKDNKLNRVANTIVHSNYIDTHAGGAFCAKLQYSTLGASVSPSAGTYTIDNTRVKGF